jgi:hypothetical protein
MKVILHTIIKKIEEKFEAYDHKKDGTFSQRSLGWFIQFDGSSESIKLFDDQPEWAIGDPITITFERTH